MLEWQVRAPPLRCFSLLTSHETISSDLCNLEYNREIEYPQGLTSLELNFIFIFSEHCAEQQESNGSA